MSLETDALRAIETTLPHHKRPLLAFSGGKDSLVLAHMLGQIGISLPVISVVCVLFPEEEQDVYEAAQRLGIAPCFHKELTPERLAAVHHRFFPPHAKANTILYAHRHQPAIDRHARAGDHDLILFGRRREENTVPSQYYQRKGFPAHCLHPMIDWPPGEVWAYIHRHNVWHPRCYREGAKQLRTWVSFLIDAHSRDPEGCVGRLYERWPPAVELCSRFWRPAAEYLRTRSP